MFLDASTCLLFSIHTEIDCNRYSNAEYLIDFFCSVQHICLLTSTWSRAHVRDHSRSCVSFELAHCFYLFLHCT